MMLRLPVPPSTNHLFATYGDRRVRTREYRAWAAAAGWEMQSQPRQAVKGPVALHFYLPFNARRDISNYVKPLEDLLVVHRMIEGDSMKIVRRLTVAIHPENFVGVKIEPFTEPLAELNVFRPAGAFAA